MTPPDDPENVNTQIAVSTGFRDRGAAQRPTEIRHDAGRSGFGPVTPRVPGSPTALEPQEKRMTGNETRLITTKPSPDAQPAAAGPPAHADEAKRTRMRRDGQADPVVGWLAIVQGPGRGCACEIGAGLNFIGREGNNRIVLDFGDTAISRERAAGIAFDPQDKSFTLMPGEGANLVRLNEKKVLQPVELATGDKILIGQTVLRFVALCGSDFDWDQA